jgi:hypothetical protein
VNAITLFGVVALSFMMLMYALERRHPFLVLAFGAGCALSSAYGFLSGAWPFGVVELIWCFVAVAAVAAFPAEQGAFQEMPRPSGLSFGDSHYRVRRSTRYSDWGLD